MPRKLSERHHECCICFNNYAGTEFVRLPCQHFFCSKCMKTYSGIYVSEGTVNKLQCPDAKCRGMVPPNVLKGLLDEKEYESWEYLMLQKTLESMTDVAYCPRCQTPCIEDEDRHAQCSKCFCSFCTVCREKWHVGKECSSFELKLQMLEKRKEPELIYEVLSLKEILRAAKQCPTCKMAISRIDGCNKMVCVNCGKPFCYGCNEAVEGYDHFRNDKCKLIPEVKLETVKLKTRPCPNCGQFNTKARNNNHMFCWSCEIRYCYLCGLIVEDFTQHYGRRGCKQHTLG